MSQVAAANQMGFYPRLRAGGDAGFRAALQQPEVSIHASAREATGSFNACCRRLVFLSTPPRGRRLGDDDDGNHCVLFLSTPPRGRRRFAAGTAKSASEFLSTPPRGRRLEREDRIHFQFAFLSTPPRGRRLGTSTAQACVPRFYPRLRAGGDGQPGRLPPDAKVSIHASAREATFNRKTKEDFWQFLSTPPRGRRHNVKCLLDEEAKFLSTPPRGRRLAVLSRERCGRRFLSTPPRGRRRTDHNDSPV